MRQIRSWTAKNMESWLETYMFLLFRKGMDHKSRWIGRAIYLPSDGWPSQNQLQSFFCFFFHIQWVFTMERSSDIEKNMKGKAKHGLCARFITLNSFLSFLFPLFLCYFPMSANSMHMFRLPLSSCTNWSLGMPCFPGFWRISHQHRRTWS